MVKKVTLHTARMSLAYEKWQTSVIETVEYQALHTVMLSVG